MIVDIIKYIHVGYLSRVGVPTLLFYMEALNRKIVELAGSISDDYNIKIVDVELAGSMRKPIVRVFIDKEEGVTLEDCEKFNRALSAILDVEDPIQTSYILEVSSPGLDRPLKRSEDFERNIGKKIRIITKEEINRQNFFTGRLREIKNNEIALILEKEKEVNIPINKIAKAKLEIEIK